MKNKRTILVVIIAAQMLCAVFIDSRKQEFHIDEIYSYVLSNSFHADRISNADRIWDEWNDEGRLSEFITVQNGEQFAFGTVYRNNSTDCHPPLYYWLLHSVCSLKPGTFSKWTGLGLNMLFFIVTLIVTYRISALIIGDLRTPAESLSCSRDMAQEVMVCLPVIMYGFSPIAAETLSFIRMYMMITMLAVILLYIHLRMERNSITWTNMLSVWMVMYLGAMTHYYFIVLCFWTAVFFIFRRLKSRNRDASVKKTVVYGAGCLAAGGLFLISYPYVISQVRGTTTNNVGNEICKNLFNWALWVKKTIYLAVCQIKTLSYVDAASYLLAFLILIAAVCMIINRRRAEEGNGSQALYIAEVYILTFLSVSFIGGEYVFLRYIYFIGPFLYVLIGYIISLSVIRRPVAANSIICVVIIFVLFNAACGALTDRSPYLYRDAFSDDKLLEEFENDSVIVLTERNPAVPTGNLTKISIFRRFYMAGAEDVLARNIIRTCLKVENECVVYINTDTLYTDGYNGRMILDEIKEHCPEYVLNIEHLCNGSLGEYYRIRLHHSLP